MVVSCHDVDLDIYVDGVREKKLSSTCSLSLLYSIIIYNVNVQAALYIHHRTYTLASYRSKLGHGLIPRVRPLDERANIYSQAQVEVYTLGTTAQTS